MLLTHNIYFYTNNEILEGLRKKYITNNLTDNIF